MNWKKWMSRFCGQMTREKWLLLLLFGVLLMILAFPAPSRRTETKTAAESQGQAPLWQGEEEAGEIQTASAKAGAETSYENQLESRVREILRSVEGVGEVEVMVVTGSFGEKVMRVDRSVSTSSTAETDSSGGSRQSSQSQSQESTVLTGTGSGTTQPVIEKELSPEIAGIIISAQGGGSPAVKAEISEAMEALFGLPAHKIKVLKRVE